MRPQPPNDGGGEKAGNIFENPLLHFVNYGLSNPIVVWALEHGLYDEWCPECRGTGEVRVRPCFSCAGTGDLSKAEHTRSLSGRCPDCRRVCPSCRGSKLRKDRQLCEQDFGDKPSRKVALQIGIREKDIEYRRQLR